jgi:ArsR family transcriptional regulator
MKTDQEQLAAPAEGLRAVADPLRWRILESLRSEDLCVCHLVEVLGAPQSLVSHHLRVLRKAGLVETERCRYWTYYRLNRAALAALGQQLIDLTSGGRSDTVSRRPCC